MPEALALLGGDGQSALRIVGLWHENAKRRCVYRSQGTEGRATAAASIRIVALFGPMAGPDAASGPLGPLAHVCLVPWLRFPQRQVALGCHSSQIHNAAH